MKTLSFNSAAASFSGVDYEFPTEDFTFSGFETMEPYSEPSMFSSPMSPSISSPMSMADAPMIESNQSFNRWNDPFAKETARDIAEWKRQNAERRREEEKRYNSAMKRMSSIGEGIESFGESLSSFGMAGVGMLPM